MIKIIAGVTSQHLSNNSIRDFTGKGFVNDDHINAYERHGLNSLRRIVMYLNFKATGVSPAHKYLKLNQVDIDE